MSSVAAIATYRPCWLDGEARAAGPDEDLVTMAVAAARPLAADGVGRVVVVSRELATAPSNAVAVLAAALGIGDTPVELRLGGAPATVDALVGGAPGTLVVAVAPAAAAAALLGEGDGLGDAGRVHGGFPLIRAAGVHDDPRLLRERAWKPALAGFGEAVVARDDAAEPLFALADLEDGGRVVGLE